MLPLSALRFGRIACELKASACHNIQPIIEQVQQMAQQSDTDWSVQYSPQVRQLTIDGQQHAGRVVYDDTATDRVEISQIVRPSPIASARDESTQAAENHENKLAQWLYQQPYTLNIEYSTARWPYL
ncbi:MAG: hypothetical protein SFZ03_01675 [Candidatus Melainabacteria bacterium]|nr:hypothetical protein [Candidatus Melainabacteria bacterium]